jgi:hypothetical protein
MQRKPKKTPHIELLRERVREIAGIEQLSIRQKGIDGEGNGDQEEGEGDREMQQWCFLFVFFSLSFP